MFLCHSSSISLSFHLRDNTKLRLQTFLFIPKLKLKVVVGLYQLISAHLTASRANNPGANKNKNQLQELIK